MAKVKYLAVAELANEQNGEVTKATMKVLITAENYTDAEKTTMEFWEDRFKDRFPTIDVTKITPEKYSRAIVLVNDLDEGVVFKANVMVSYDGGKFFKKVLYGVSECIEDSVKDIQTYVDKKYQPIQSRITKIEETDILAISPVFENVQDENKEN